MNIKSQSQVKTTSKPMLADLLQRKCACGQHTIAGGECAECRQKREGMIQRAAISPASVNGVPSIVHEVLSSPGQPLNAGTRAFMEPRFGYDFSQVRVHTDARAAESAQAVNALAYTVGRGVVFGEGQYAPETSGGRRLLAHELTHVVQQGSSTSIRSGISSLGDSDELEADQVGSAILTGQQGVVRTQASPPLLQRQEDLKLRLPWSRPKRLPSLFPPGEEPHLRLDRGPQPRSASLLKLTLPPPSLWEITREQMQEALKQSLPVNVSVSGAGAKGKKRKFFEPLKRETDIPFGLDLGVDTNLNFQIAAVARHLDAVRFNLGGKIPLDIVHELNFIVGVSGSQRDFGTATAQILVTLFNFHLTQYGTGKDAKDSIELGLGQLGIGFDNKGNYIMQVGAQLEKHWWKSEHVSIALNTGGQLKVHEGKATWEWQPISLSLIIHWMNP
jgi:hypothetical protein